MFSSISLFFSEHYKAVINRLVKDALQRITKISPEFRRKITEHLKTSPNPLSLNSILSVVKTLYNEATNSIIYSVIANLRGLSTEFREILYFFLNKQLSDSNGNVTSSSSSLGIRETDKAKWDNYSIGNDIGHILKVILSSQASTIDSIVEETINSVIKTISGRIKSQSSKELLQLDCSKMIDYH